MTWLAKLKRLDSFLNRVTGMNTASDKITQTEIAAVVPLSETGLENLHRSNAYAGVFVDELVEEATRKGWYVKADDVPEGVNEADITGDFDDDWRTKELVREVDVMGRLRS